ncbi:FixH family protein [Pontibacter pamirensis]|uniref:FixH family protein n=1 Tax=Pontibacter pamirensis TaxID=2562824 RepID=UPI001389F63A|nr:FixH family protein [Pontibacter pamirensis]
MVTQNKNKSFTLWPYAIIAAIVLFMGYIIFFVVQAMNQDVDLVSKDYYEQEIAFQDHIEMVGRTKAVGDVVINYKPESQAILLQLPKSFAGQQITGRVNLFRPSDDKLDQEVPLQLGRDLSQLVETDNLEKGLWKVRVNFSAGEETYYTEETIQLK